QELDHTNRTETYIKGGSNLGGNTGSVPTGNQHAVIMKNPNIMAMALAISARRLVVDYRDCCRRPINLG
ncbi:hypothetical protein, partial [Rhizobium sp. AC27/96]|uniref:hypothetical protein n=1 Tax=Rhizobium sp. AC27/96 TaxID=1841653 RepID=UPI001A7E14E8